MRLLTDSIDIGGITFRATINRRLVIQSGTNYLYTGFERNQN